VACKCTRGRLQSSCMSCSRCMHNLIYACHTSAGTFISQHGPGCTLCQQFELALPILLPCITSQTSLYGEADTIPVSCCAYTCMNMAWYQLILQPLCGCHISAASVHIAEGSSIFYNRMGLHSTSQSADSL